LELLPDLPTLSDDDLRNLIRRYENEENEVSYRRRILHGYIDILRAEVVARRKQGGGGALEDIDIDRLSDILSAKATPSGGGRDREEEATGRKGEPEKDPA
jgi:hypothetical protein